jgi:hypothetical protein
VLDYDKTTMENSLFNAFKMLNSLNVGIGDFSLIWFIRSE